MRPRLLAILCAALLAVPAARANVAPDPAPAPRAPLDADDITPGSTLAVDRALAWLAANQNEDGSWDGEVGYKLNQDYKVTATYASHPGVTALAGMAFLAAGHLPGRGEYGLVIAKATRYVTSRVNVEGFISHNGTRMYSHAFAALFLAEVYGMSGDRDFRDKLQSAIDYIVGCQNAEGAWRYSPLAVESDMSIAVCQLNALRAARNVGIRVPRSTIERAAAYIAASYVPEDVGYPWHGESYYALGKGAFAYQAQRFTRSSFALTAAGLAALHNVGHYGDTLMHRNQRIDLRPSVEFLKDLYPNVSGSSRWRHHYFYWYGHYYATQALYVIGGQDWDWYYPRIRDEIVNDQNPDGTMPITAGPGPAFSTAVGALILSLPYGYLPIFQR